MSHLSRAATCSPSWRSPFERGWSWTGTGMPATGFMGRNADGKMTVARVVLRPEVSLGSPAPSPEAFEKLHEIAHEECFIANSVRTAVTVEGRMVSPGKQ